MIYQWVFILLIEKKKIKINITPWYGEVYYLTFLDKKFEIWGGLHILKYLTTEKL